MSRRARIAQKVSLCLLVLAAPEASAFYLPGSAPRSYAQGDRVPVLVNALTPQLSGNRAQLRSVISYDYYTPEFHFCPPPGDAPKKQSESLGSILAGDRIFNSPFSVRRLTGLSWCQAHDQKIRMLENVSCASLCTTTVPPEDAKFINERIKEDYALNWLIDGLPAAEQKREIKTNQVFYSIGFALGDQSGAYGPNPALNNHYLTYIDFHRRSATEFRVVGVVVVPVTSASPAGSSEPDCSGTRAMLLNEDSGSTVHYSYSVIWRESKTPWATRWDNYLHIFDPRIHWFSLINSIVIACFLCAMVAMILARAVNKDLSRYNSLDLSEDIQEDYGWRLLHADVFRSPQHPMMLAVTVGSGAQLCAMAGVTLIFALLGFLSPSNRGSLSTAMIVSWTLLSSVAGFVSSRLYVSLHGTSWKRNIFLTATLFPGTIFAAMFLLNLFLIGSGAAGAIPFGTMLAVLALYFLISLPLTCVGAYFGLKRGPIKPPRSVNQIPRQIPPQPYYLKPWPASLLAGILPFGAAFIELFFILSSIFAHRLYIAFGFLALTFLVMALTTATVTILMCYFQLCAEDHRWQWRSFHVGGGVAFWVLIYGAIYATTRLSLDGWSSKILYAGYLSLIAFVLYLTTGTIAFLATTAFMLRIYAALRVD